MRETPDAPDAPDAGSPLGVRFGTRVVLTKEEAFGACQALADAGEASHQQHRRARLAGAQVLAAQGFHFLGQGERARQTHPTGHRGELWMSRSPMTTEAE